MVGGCCFILNGADDAQSIENYATSKIAINLDNDSMHPQP